MQQLMQHQIRNILCRFKEDGCTAAPVLCTYIDLGILEAPYTGISSLDAAESTCPCPHMFPAVIAVPVRVPDVHREEKSRSRSHPSQGPTCVRRLHDRCRAIDWLVLYCSCQRGAETHGFVPATGNLARFVIFLGARRSRV